jgi:hypothetical protein
LTLVFCEALRSIANARSCGQRPVAMITPRAWSIIARDTIDNLSWSFWPAQEASRSATVSAPEACAANSSARAVSSGPKASGGRAYSTSAPAGFPSLSSGTA